MGAAAIPRRRRRMRRMEAEIACYGFSSFIPVLRKMAKD
jgi:hypothetical protein